MKKNFTKRVAALSATIIVALSGNAISTVSASTTSTNLASRFATSYTRLSNVQVVSKAGVFDWILSLIQDIQMRNKLNNVMNGNVKLFSNDNGTFPVGTSLNNSKTYYVNKKWSGKQCYIYAQAVYWYLTGDYVGHGSVGSHSKKCITNVKTVSYNQFKNAGVKPGAYIRTTANSNGSYNGNKGHSMIVVSYDANTITVLEGNGNGKGLVRTNSVTWSQFNKSYLTNRGYRVCHVISPK